MEHFFSPAQRHEDQLPNTDEPFEYEVVELAVPVEEFLNHRWDWKDLRAFLVDGEMLTIAWITEDSFIWVRDEHSEAFCPLEISEKNLSAKFTAASGAEETLFLVKRPRNSASVLAEASSIFWHAVTTSNCVTLVLTACSSLGLCSGLALSHFFRASPLLRDLQFADIDFKEDHCRALATLERTDLKIRFWYCTLDTKYAEAVFIEWLRHGQVVTEVIGCTMKSSSVLSALSGNSSVRSFSYDLDSCRFENCEDYIRQLAQALPGNNGLVNLRLSWSTHHRMPDEMWTLMFRSLWTHPLIEYLSLSYDSCIGEMPPHLIRRRMEVVRQMVQRNTVVHTIYLPDTNRGAMVYYHYEILPRLKMNRSYFEEQRRAIKRSDPSIRGQLLGRALYVVRYNPNLIFRFLSENVTTFVRTEEEEVDASIVPLEQDPVIVSVSGQKRNAPS
jgi:hypothetical protein